LNKGLPILKLYGIGLLCLLPVLVKAQYAPEWDDYKRWGLHVDKVWYLPAGADKKYGVYDIENYIMPGINVGFEYYIEQGEIWSFFTGIDMEWLPFYNFDYDPLLPKTELPTNMQVGRPDIIPEGYYAAKWVNAHNVLAIPIGVSAKKMLSPKFFTTISASANIKLMQSGGWAFSRPVVNKQGQEMDFFTIEASGASRTIFYPCVNLSAGINYMNKYSIVRLSLKVQKSIVPFFEGEYRFMNLAQSPDTYGTYKV
jgi:hypothetical protein